MTSIEQSTVERFMKRVDRTTECWVWTGCLETSGYGRVSVNGKNKYAHRVAYEIEHGEIGSGLEVDHVCRNRACVRASHLRAVTRSQNQQNLSQGSEHSGSGQRGVTWHPKTQTWRSRVKLGGETVHETFHPTVEDATAAVISARNKYMTHNDADRLGAQTEAEYRDVRRAA